MSHRTLRLINIVAGIAAIVIATIVSPIAIGIGAGVIAANHKPINR